MTDVDVAVAVAAIHSEGVAGVAVRSVTCLAAAAVAASSATREMAGEEGEKVVQEASLVVVEEDHQNHRKQAKTFVRS